MKKNSGGSAVQGVLVLVLALSLPFAARAANDSELRNHIISINSLYENLDYEVALRRIPLALKLPHGADEEVTLTLYEGILLYELGRHEPSASAFRAALLLRPDSKLPVQVAPKIEALFESVRKQVKQELESRLPPRAMESPSNKAEQKREVASTPPATGPAPEKREDEKLAQPLKKEEPPSKEPKASTSTAQVAEAEVKVAPTPPASSSPKAQQKNAEAVAEQTVTQPDCTPESPPPGRGLKERQLSRLAGMKHTLCQRGKFQGLVSGSWRELKNQMENATTSDEKTRIAQDIDLFASEFIYEDPQRKAEWQEAKRQEAERLEAKRQEDERREAEQREVDRAQLKKNAHDASNLDTSQCQPVVSSACDLLIQRLHSIQDAFLLTDPPSKLIPIRELARIGQEIRAARTSEELQEAAKALDSWKQRRLSQ